MRLPLCSWWHGANLVRKLSEEGLQAGLRQLGMALLHRLSPVRSLTLWTPQRPGHRARIWPRRQAAHRLAK